MNNKIQYRRYTPVGEALRAMLKFYGLAPELDRRRIYAAWDDASGAGPYTIRKQSAYFIESNSLLLISSEARTFQRIKISLQT